MKLLFTLMIMAALPVLAQSPMQPHEVTEQAAPGGGLQVFNQFVVTNLNIPFATAVRGVSGRVYLKAVVEPDGTVTDVEVTRGIDPPCDREAVRVFSLYRAWKPALLNGKPVRQIVHFPISIQQKPTADYDTTLHAMVVYLDEKLAPTAQHDKAQYRRILPLDDEGNASADLRFEERKGNKWRQFVSVPFRKTSMYYKGTYVKPVVDSVKSYQIFVRDQNLASYAPEMVFHENGQRLSYTQFNDHGKPAMEKEYDLGGMVREMHIHDDSTDTEVRWHANGQIRSVVIYPANKPAIAGMTYYSDAWDEKGNQLLKNGQGYWKDPGLDYQENWLLEEGRVAGGLKVGKWTGKRADSTLHYREMYQNGVLQTGVSYYGADSLVYDNAVRQPQFKGGMQAFYRYLAQNIRYPSDAARRGAMGKVVLSFIVCEDGTMCDYQVINRVGFGLDEEALRVVKGMNGLWSPGELRGKTVRVKYNLPVNFQLN